MTGRSLAPATLCAALALASVSCASVELYERMPAAESGLAMDLRSYDGDARTEVERFVRLVEREINEYNSMAITHNSLARTSRAWALGNGIASATGGAVVTALSLFGVERGARIAAAVGSSVVGLSITFHELSGFATGVSRASRTTGSQQMRIQDALQQFLHLSPSLRTPPGAGAAEMEAREIAIRDLRRLNDRLATLIFAPEVQSDGRP